MEDTLFEMLIYLFHNYLERKIINAMFSSNLSTQMEHMEFNPDTMIANNTPEEFYIKAPTADAIRCYHEFECNRLSQSCRGFILFIEQLGLLSTEEREAVINLLMVSESTQITMDELKWTILEVLTPGMTLPQSEFLRAIIYPGSNEQRLH